MMIHSDVIHEISLPLLSAVGAGASVWFNVVMRPLDAIRMKHASAVVLAFGRLWKCWRKKSHDGHNMAQLSHGERSIKYKWRVDEANAKKKRIKP
jgi:hypothetical protein